MKWIYENFQLVVLVVGAFAYWLKEFIENKIAEQRARQENREAADALDGSDGDYVDQEMEFPTDYQEREFPHGYPGIPPLPPLPQAGRLPGYEEAAAREAATATRHRDKLSAHLQRLRENKATTTGGAAATRNRISASRKALTGSGVKVPDVTGVASLRARLRDPAEVRRAIILKEILGPPVGLR